MALSGSQLATLKSDMSSNPDGTLQALITARDWGGVADWYNLTRSTAYWLFRDYVSTKEIQNAIDAQDIADITAADSDRAIKLLQIRGGALTGGEDVGFDGRVARDRSAWDDVFSVAAGDNSQQAILALWTRQATNGEYVFRLSTGTGADAANADTTDFYGSISLSDVLNAQAL